MSPGKAAAARLAAKHAAARQAAGLPTLLDDHLEDSPPDRLETLEVATPPTPPIAPPARKAPAAGDPYRLPAGMCDRCDCWAKYLVPAVWLPAGGLCLACCVEVDRLGQQGKGPLARTTDGATCNNGDPGTSSTGEAP